jgi:hypothetical protein
MIERVDYPRQLAAGEAFSLTVTAVEPIQVEIHCFVRKPAPPGYEHCLECGSIAAHSGQPLQLVASADAFRSEGGHLDVSISDADGDQRTIRIPVQLRLA